MPVPAARRAACRPTLVLATLAAPLALAALAAPHAGRAASVQGRLSVSVEVVASCRVSSGPGGLTAIVACGEAGRSAATPASAPAAATARAAPPGPVPVRILVEPAAEGAGWLTVVY